MACSAVVPMAVIMPLTHKATANTTTFLFNPLTINRSTRLVASKKLTLVVKSCLKENAATAIAAAALTASMAVPEVAQAASAGVSPSLNNFLLSIGAGGVVLGGILGAIIGVSNFDPVKRG